MEHGRVCSLLAAVVISGALTACGTEGRSGSEAAVAGFPRVAVGYDGPLHVDHGRYGAAGEALDCAPVDGQVSRSEVYAEGATSGDVEAALETAVSEGLFLFAPTDRVGLAKVEHDRAMLVHEEAGRILIALVFRNGPATEGAGGPGWYLETAARCDFAEFPEAFAEKAGFRLWRDRTGTPVPVSRVYSAPGPEHCSWQTMELLHVDDRDSYVREPIREVERFLAGSYRSGIPLPEGVRATGYERDGRTLWLSGDGRYAYVGTKARVEAWPRFDASCA